MLNYVNHLAFLPTKAYFHVVCTVLLARIRWVWKEERWLSYFQKEYLVEVESNADVAGTSKMLLARWWLGLSSRAAPGFPPSQQAVEQLNAKLKRTFRVDGMPSTHSEVLERLAAAAASWAAPPQSDTDKPLTLLGKACRSGRPLEPDEWMERVGASVRRPFAKPLVGGSSGMP